MKLDDANVIEETCIEQRLSHNAQSIRRTVLVAWKSEQGLNDNEQSIKVAMMMTFAAEEAKPVKETTAKIMSTKREDASPV